MRKIVLSTNNYLTKDGKEQTVLFGMVDYCLYRIFTETDRPYLTMDAVIAYENAVRRAYNPNLLFDNTQVKLKDFCFFVDNTYIFISQALSLELENVRVTAEKLPPELQKVLNDKENLAYLGLSGDLNLDTLNTYNRIDSQTLDKFASVYGNLAEFSGAETLMHPEKYPNSVIAKSLQKAQFYNIEEALAKKEADRPESTDWLQKSAQDEKERNYYYACMIDYIFTYFDLARNARSPESLCDNCKLGDDMWNVLIELDKINEKEQNDNKQKGA